MSTSDYRRENLRRLIAACGGPSAVADRLGYSNASYVVQMTGPNPTRPVSERTARTVEEVFLLPALSLDEPVFVEFSSAEKPLDPPTPSMNAEHFVQIINAVVRVCDEEGANISHRKFADILSLVVLDVGRRKGGVDESMMKTLVRLAQ